MRDKLWENAERMARALDNRDHLFLKARILGEAFVPDAEREFITTLENRLTVALNWALKGLSRISITALLAWWISFLPITAILLEASSWKPWVAGGSLGLWLIWLIGVPWVFRRFYPRLFEFHIDRVRNRTLREVLPALACLRTDAAAQALRRVQYKIKEQVPARADSSDEFVKFTGMIVEQIEQAVELSHSDPDTVLSEIEVDPALLNQWFDLDPFRFTSNDLQVLAKVLRKREVAWDQAQLDCIRKLTEVCRNRALHNEVIEVLQAFIDSRAGKPELLKAARTALEMISHPAKQSSRTPSPWPSILWIGLLLGLLLSGLIFGYWWLE